MILDNMTEAEISELERENYAKFTIKDSVFSDLFHIDKYLLELYHVLHPEDKEATIDDLEDVTIRNVLINDILNDLGFRVGGRLIILVECQAVWTINIIVRALIYLARSYQLYFKEQGVDLYGTKKVELPKPEIYVIYIGDGKDKPDEILLSKEFFGGESAAIEVKIKVICETEKTDIINQYIIFSKVYNEQRVKYGRTKKAVLETIRICKDRNILREYLELREKEVVDIMMALFDEQEIREMHDRSLEKISKIQTMIEDCQDFGFDRSKTVARLIEKFNLPQKEAEKSVSEFWR